MTTTATTSLRDRVQAAYTEAQRLREDNEAQEAAATLDKVRTETLKLIAEILGADTVTDNGLSIDTQGWGSARFSIDSIPFFVRKYESEWTGEWQLFVERPCTRKGCTKGNIPALVQVLDLDDVARAILKSDAAHEYGLHCTDQPGQPTRTIIQIAASAYASQVTNEDGIVSSTLFALCDDGTLWQRDADRPVGAWRQITPPNYDDQVTR